MGTVKNQFNAKVNIDFMFIEEVDELCINIDATHFSTTQFAESLTTEAVWETKSSLWETLYTRFSNTLFSDN